MKRLRSKLTFSNVVAMLALFIALGGASYAATQLPKNSVGAKQLKRGAVTPTKLNQKSMAALQGPRGLQGPKGDPGSKGDPGAPAVSLWAHVFSSGGFDYSSGATSSEKFGTGSYVVSFNRDVSKCGYIGTLNFSPGEIIVEDHSTEKNAVIVETFKPDGVTNMDLWFTVAVLC